MRSITAPNGRVIHFPPGTTDEEILAALAQVDQRDYAPESGFGEGAAGLFGRFSGAVTDGFIAPIVDWAQPDAAPPLMMDERAVPKALRLVSPLFRDPNLINRGVEVAGRGVEALGRGASWVKENFKENLGVSAPKWYDAVESVGRNVGRSLNEARTTEDARRQAAGQQTLEQESADLYANRSAEAIADVGQNTRDYWQTDETWAEQQEFGKAWAPEKPLWDSAMWTLQNLGASANVIGPDMAAVMLPSTTIARAGRVGSMGKAIAAADEAALLAQARGMDVVEVGIERMKAITAAAARTGEDAANLSIGLQGAQITAMGDTQARDEVMSAKLETLRKLPGWNELEAQYGENEARAVLARRAGDMAIASGIPLNAAGVGVTRALELAPVESLLAGGRGVAASRAGLTGRVQRSGVGAIRETAGETLQGGLEQLSVGAGLSSVGLQDSAWEGVGRAMLMEGMMGAPMGGLAGVLSGPAADGAAAAARIDTPDAPVVPGAGRATEETAEEADLDAMVAPFMATPTPEGDRGEAATSGEMAAAQVGAGPPAPATSPMAQEVQDGPAGSATVGTVGSVQPAVAGARPDAGAELAPTTTTAAPAVAPPAPGFVRLYTGASVDPSEWVGQQFFTTSESQAQGYAKRAGEGGTVRFIDVPASDPRVQREYDDGTTVVAQIDADEARSLGVASNPALPAASSAPAAPTAAPVARAETAPRTGVEAGQIIDTKIAGLTEAAKGVLPTPQVKALLDEAEELDAVIAEQKASPSPATDSPAIARRAEIQQQLTAHSKARSAAQQLTQLQERRGAATADADLIALSLEIQPQRRAPAPTVGTPPASVAAPTIAPAPAPAPPASAPPAPASVIDNGDGSFTVKTESGQTRLTGRNAREMAERLAAMPAQDADPAPAAAPAPAADAAPATAAPASTPPPALAGKAQQGGRTTSRAEAGATQAQTEEGAARRDMRRNALAVVIQRQIAAWGFKAKFTIVANAAQLRAELKKRGLDYSVDGQTEGLFIPNRDNTDGEVIVVLDALASPERAAWVVAHETAAHLGLRRLLGPKLDAHLQRAAQNPTVRAIGNAIYQEALEEWRKNAEGARPVSDGLVFIEEALAEIQAAIRTNDFAGLRSRYGVDTSPLEVSTLERVLMRFIRGLQALLNNDSNSPPTEAELRDLLERAYTAAKKPAKRSGSDAAAVLQSRRETDEYAGEHQPPMADSGAPGHDVTGEGNFYPDDVYGPNGLRYYGTGDPAMDAAAYAVIQRLRGSPNRFVTVYRAVPKSAKTPIKPGDWVTTVRRYATEHGRGALNGDFKIQEKLVSARDIFTNGDSWLEWGYDPQPFDQAAQDALNERRAAKKATGESDPLLQSRQANDITDTPAFARWFGDSKVVDEDGKPLVVFKGMNPSDWRTGAAVESIDAPDRPYAGFFSSDVDVANRFADAYTNFTKNTFREGVDDPVGAAVYPVFISMSRPFVIDAGGAFAASVQFNDTVRGWSKSELTAALNDDAYDGVIITNTADEGDVYIPKRPTQIKSATGNNGQFDPENPSILQSRSADVIDLVTGKEQPPKLTGKTEVAQFLERRGLERLGRVLDLEDAADRDHIADAMAREALHALAAKGNAGEWYDETIRKLMRLMAVKHTEIATDPDARTAFTLALAITSQNLAVPDNLKYADEVYDHFRQHKRWPEIGFGAKGPSMVENFRKANALLDEFGGNMDMFRRFLATPFTVRQLNRMGFNIGGELADENVLGSSLFGPKIGFGFYSNLTGNFAPVTMDMWFMRTIGRLRGKLMSYDPVNFSEQLDRLRKADPKVRKLDEDSLVVEAFQIVKRFEKDFKVNRAKYDSGRKVKTQAVFAAQTIVKSLKGTVDAPASGQERRLLRDVVGRAIDKMAAVTGKVVEAAAFQALIWYPEQKLYKDLGVKLKAFNVDYATAAREHLLEQGYDPGQLESAAGATRPAAADVGSGVEGSSQERSGGNEGLAPRDRRRLLTQRVLIAQRVGGSGNAKASKSYSRRGGTRPDRLRGVVATYTPSVAYGNVLDDAEHPRVILEELDHSPASARRFADALRSAKEGSRFGAAVHVYDEASYAEQRLFITPDGKSGFSIKADGDIVSVFSDGGGKTPAMLQLAVEQGGTKLDAFDTALPDIYNISGFREVSRAAWDNEQRPDGWDEATFAKYQGGRPDIVFMEYDQAFDPYATTPAQGELNKPAAPLASRAPTFYSAALKAVESTTAPKRATSDTWSGWLDGAVRRGEMKQSERDWLGIDGWLDSRKAATREELAEFIRANQVQVEDVVLSDMSTKVSDDLNLWMEDNDSAPESPEEWLTTAFYLDREAKTYERSGDEEEANRFTELAAEARRHATDASAQGAVKFAQYQLPGGQNYREVLLTLPSNERPARAAFDAFKAAMQAKYRDSGQWVQKLTSDEEIERGNLARAAAMEGEEQGFRSSHYDQPNILAHVRFNERTDAEGRKVLFIEEIQSDWHQQGRKKGYRKANETPWDRVKSRGYKSRYSQEFGGWELYDNNGDPVGFGDTEAAAIADFNRQDAESTAPDGPVNDGGVPDAPIGAKNAFAVFKGDVEVLSADNRKQRYDTMKAAQAAAEKIGGEARSLGRVEDTEAWAMLAFKRMVRWAAESGMDAIAWTTGEQQNERYDLSKQVNSIGTRPMSGGGRMVYVGVKADGSSIQMQVDADGRIVGVMSMRHQDLDGKMLDEVIGKDMTEKVMASNDAQEFTGLDLKVGGTGMKGFYDTILPLAVGKWAKKFGGKVGRTQMGDGIWKVFDGDGDLRYEALTEQAARQWVKNNDRVEGATVKSAAPEQHSLALTQPMRDAALSGMPLFSRAQSDNRDMSMLAYPGSTGPSIEAPKPGERWFHGRMTSERDFAPGRPAFFARDYASAKWFVQGEEGGAVTEHLVDARNPARTRDLEETLLELGYQLEDDDRLKAEVAKHSEYSGENETDVIYIPAVRKALEAKGFDSLLVFDTIENTDTEALIVWDTAKIKPAPLASRAQSRSPRPDLRQADRAPLDAEPVVAKALRHLKDQVGALQSAMSGRVKNPATVRRRINDVRAAMFDSIVSRARALEARNPDAPSLKTLFNQFMASAGDSRLVGETVNDAIASRFAIFTNRARNILAQNGLGAMTSSENASLRKAMLNPEARVPANVREAATLLRGIMDVMREDLIAVGVEVGEVTDIGYLTRIYDDAKILTDEAGFLEAARSLYRDHEFALEVGTSGRNILYTDRNHLARFLAAARRAGQGDPAVASVLADIKAKVKSYRGTSDLQTVLEIETLIDSIYPAVAESYANVRAAAWLHKIATPQVAEHFAGVSPSAAPITKARELSAAADTVMAGYMKTDMLDILDAYGKTVARKVEHAARFGPKGEKIQALIDAARREGVPTRDLEIATNLIDSVSGQNRKLADSGLKSAADFLHAWGYLALLSKAAMASAFEAITYALRTGDLRHTAAPIIQVFRAATRSRYGKDLNAMALAIGVNGHKAVEEVMLNQLGGDYSMTPQWSRLLQAFFRANFLTPITRAQRAYGVGASTGFLRELSKNVMAGRDSTNTAALLNEVGIADHRAFAQWMLAQPGSLPDIQTLFDENGRATPRGQDYMVAVRRIIDQSIQNPGAEHRPAWTNSPGGRLVTGIMSFSYASYENIIRREMKLARRNWTDGERGDFTNRAAKAALATTALVVAQTGMSVLREIVFNAARFEDKDDDEIAEEMILLGLSRTFGLGSADPIVQYITGLKYQRSAAETAIGAVPGFALQTIDRLSELFTDRNSGNNDTTEFRAAQAFYGAVITPAINVLLSRLPGGGVAIIELSDKAYRDQFAALFSDKPEPRTKLDDKYQEAVKELEAVESAVEDRIALLPKEQWAAELAELKAEYPSILAGVELDTYADNTQNRNKGRAGMPKSSKDGKPALRLSPDNKDEGSVLGELEGYPYWYKVGKQSKQGTSEGIQDRITALNKAIKNVRNARTATVDELVTFGRQVPGDSLPPTVADIEARIEARTLKPLTEATQAQRNAVLEELQELRRAEKRAALAIIEKGQRGEHINRSDKYRSRY